MHRCLRLTVIFESYEHELEAYERGQAPTSKLLFVTLSCGLRPNLTNFGF